MPYFPITDTKLSKQRDKEIIPIEDELMEIWENDFRFSDEDGLYEQYPDRIPDDLFEQRFLKLTKEWGETFFHQHPNVAFLHSKHRSTNKKKSIELHVETVPLWKATPKQIAQYHKNYPKAAEVQLGQKWVVENEDGQLCMNPERIPEVVVEHGPNLPCVQHKFKCEGTTATEKTPPLHPKGDEQGKKEVKATQSSQAAKSANETYEKDAQEMLKDFEGVSPWMYQDIKGLITVGRGILIKKVETAQEEPFIWQRDETQEDRKMGYSSGQAQASLRKKGDRASRIDIKMDYKRVEKLKQGIDFHEYKAATCLELKKNYMKERFQKAYHSHLGELKKWLPKFEDYPKPAKLALINMVYNLGLPKLEGFTKMKTAIELGDWATAGKECIYNSGTPKLWGRNSFNQKKFIEAHALKEKEAQ